jgi:hypothetical protein
VQTSIFPLNNFVRQICRQLTNKLTWTGHRAAGKNAALAEMDQLLGRANTVVCGARRGADGDRCIYVRRVIMRFFGKFRISVS